jgi:small nuclear ribonucleoprotein
MTKKRPLDVLNASLNKRVIVHLRSGREYRGTLDGYDHPHLNLVLKQVEEIHKVGTADEVTHKRELVIVRGDNIIYISP